MSYIDSELTEECITDATMDQLEKVLQKHGYEITRTRIQISAKYGGFWTTNGKFSYITIIDRDGLRYCTDKETAKGYMCTPHSGVLAKLVQEAENLS